MKHNLSKWTLAVMVSLLFAGAALAAPAPAAPAAPANDVCLQAAAAAPVTPVAAPVAPVFMADGKCASCPDLLKACKSFCGSNNVTFNCQNHNPCAGTCTCTV